MVSRGKKSRSIRTRLFLLLIAAFLPILIIQAHIYYRLYETRRAEELQANLEVARSVARTFDSFVKDVLGDELAIGIAATSNPPLSSDDLKRLLIKSARENPALRNYAWSSPEGWVLASIISPEGVDFSNRPFFREIVAGRECIVSELLHSWLTGEPVFVIARGIRDEQGKLLGIVTAAVVPEKLNSLLDVERTKDAGISLIDNKGMHVFRYPASEYTWEQRNWRKIYPEMEAALAGEEVATVVTSESSGKNRLVGFVPVSHIGWVAAASRSEEDVMAAITSGLLSHGSLFLFVTLLAFTIALALCGRISGSIKRLRDHALALGQGEVENVQVTRGTAEIEELSNAFNEMARKVRSREEALKRQEEFLRATFESTENAIILVDEEARCVEANPAAGRITGLPHRDLVGRSLPEFVNAGPGLAEVWSSFLQTGRLSREIGIRHRDGTWHTVDVVGVANILPCRHLFVGHDITERKRKDEELRRARDELELRVRERTAELERTNQELQEFAFVASHDLSEPLRKIQTFGTLLEEKCSDRLDEQERDYISRMSGAARRMHKLLNALLSYSRVESKGQEFRPARLDGIAKDAVGDVDVLIKEVGARVEIGPLPTVAGDPTQLRQLFQNLIANAVKYHRLEGETVVKIKGERDNGICRILVEDNGIGFDEKYLDKIFQPFQRLHGRNEYPGIGMGLAICRKIVERHGGTITARSTPGRGSIFIVTLPTARGDSEARV